MNLGKIQSDSESVSYAKSFNSDRGKDLQNGEVINIMQDDQRHNGIIYFYIIIIFSLAFEQISLTVLFFFLF